MAQGAISDIKGRIKSIESTKQITKAMELVATSKLRRQRQRASDILPFYDLLRKSISLVVNCLDENENPWVKPINDNKTLQIVIAGDRGLAGGYNSNVFKLSRLGRDDNTVILPIGKKACEHFKSSGATLLTDEVLLASEIGVGISLSLAEKVAKGYLLGEYGKVELIYTEFKSMLTQTAMKIRV